MWWLLACVENVLVGPGAGQKPFDDGADTGAPPEDSEATGDSDSAQASECPDDPPPDSSATPTVECRETVAPLSGDLVELARVSLVDGNTGVHVARLEDGNGDGVIDRYDPFQLVVDEGWRAVGVYDHHGTPLAWHDGAARRMYSVTGDVDPSLPGSEVVASGHYSDGNTFCGVYDEAAQVYSYRIFDDQDNYPWLTDLEGDGDAELLMGDTVVDLATGATVAYLDIPFAEDRPPSVSADLDLDGVEEILSADWEGELVGVWEADGSLVGACDVPAGSYYNATFAVGELDGDPEGEFVAAGSGYVAVCDSDGTLLDVVGAAIYQPSVVALGQLDGDAEREVVVADAGTLFAYDADLSLLWTYTDPTDMGGFPTSLVDLDADGLHELLVRQDEELLVLGPTGDVLFTCALGGATFLSWRAAPIAADVDADGLAEIVIGSGDLLVLESADGGWPVEEADTDWPGIGAHPGDRTESGGLPAPTDWWNLDEQNYWNARPPANASTLDRPDLGVSIVDVCVESCEGDAVVMVSVTNFSTGALTRDVDVSLTVQDGGELLGGALVVAPLDPGVTRTFSFRIPPSAIPRGLQAEVDTADRARECDLVDNDHQYRDTPCP